ncbi:MAG: N-6 DNA methylase, partial [Gammaproteobacteria bacterium]|nr:N-6 DNA methylase [Gammaproteobacteria bacterium]
MGGKKLHSAIETYLGSLSETYSTGSATEHTYRPGFHKFLKTILPNDAQIINEPKQIPCGAPDFVLTFQNIPQGYIETKNLGSNLDDDRYREQISRYSESLDNLIFTNYLEFRLLRDGDLMSTVKIGTLNTDGKLIPKRENYDDLTEILTIFWEYDGQTVTSVIDLTRHMAAKTRLLETEISRTLNDDQQDGKNLYDPPGFQKTLQRQFKAFKKGLMGNLDLDTFADICAQTVAYGMFSARLHDTSPDTFTRHNANQLIPKTNPLLRKFFDEVAGNDLDSSIRWIVDDLAHLFSRANLNKLMDDYGATTQRNDPFLHFYETFLSEYDPGLRDVRGVYYTPEPIVRFMVRAVDQILCDRFHLTQGLATTTRNMKAKGNQPLVQILDPATGTGTFLATIIKEVRDKYFSTQSGIWPEYARNHLVPRLHGFEILMAPYAMAHTKLEMVLRDSGCEPDNRLGIFLTNALEDTAETIETHYPMLSEEAESAKTIKGETPVMVVIGNPPYKAESTNSGKWIEKLLTTYKQEPGGGKLQEKNPKWLNDDYVKFIRYGQYHINNSGVGILAYINNHGFLDNPTFRGMRWSLLESFDEIYIIDLHGNAKKKELAPDGSTDQNVFDIQQGVSINLFVKTGKEEGGQAQLFHYNLYGKREEKYRFLTNNNLNSINFKMVEPQAPWFFFVPKDYSFQSEYDKGINLAELFLEKSVGIVTARDRFTIYHTEGELKSAIEEFISIDDEAARRNFSLREDTRDWKVALARQDLENHFNRGEVTPVKINYRPFDNRYTYYT